MVASVPRALAMHSHVQAPMLPGVQHEAPPLRGPAPACAAQLDVIDPGVVLMWIFGSILVLLWLLFLVYRELPSAWDGVVLTLMRPFSMESPCACMSGRTCIRPVRSLGFRGCSRRGMAGRCPVASPANGAAPLA